jgi:TonB family protein
MMLKRLGLLALLTTLAGATSGPTLRVPAAQWNVDFADAQCLASRNYGSAEEPVQLVLKTPAIGDVVQVAIARKGSWRSAVQIIASVAVDGRPPFSVSMLAFSPGSSGLRIYSMNLPAAQFALIRQARTVSVHSDGIDESFALSDMAPLLKIVDGCVADLRQVYNITDSANGETSSLKVRAKANLISFFTDDDYPGAAQGRDQGGKVKFALLIAEDGRVADCTIIETSGVASLDSQACAILRSRARFRPAADSEGRAAKDAVVGKITWRID